MIMARVEIRMRNGDQLVVNTSDPAEIERLENEPFDDASNVSSTHVTED
jgi:hypothetical protein